MRTPLALGLLLVLIAFPAAAQPYRPTHDGEVLERLSRAAGGELEDLRRLQRQLATEPENLKLAATLARLAIALGRGSGDPRFYGYAQAALAPWWESAQAPSEVLLLRAAIRRNRHDFSGAVEDLDRLLIRQPRHAGAWLTRAIVLLVQGEPRAAAESCARLTRLDAFTAAVCAGTVAGVVGQGEAGYTLLETTLRESPEAPPELRRWALTSQAEIAVRRSGEEWIERAEARFRDALALEGAEDSDIYLRAAFADFLLEQGRPQEVLDFLAPVETSDALLLRRALAAHRLGTPEAGPLRRRLKDRYEAARRRGSSLHLGLEARFALEIEDDPHRALDLALKNWQRQREPIDAWIVIAAAQAADKPEAAESVWAWVDETGLEDRRLRRDKSTPSPSPAVGRDELAPPPGPTLPTAPLKHDRGAVRDSRRASFPASPLSQRGDRRGILGDHRGDLPEALS